MSTTLEARKHPIQARSRATVDAILEATAQVLVEEGYDKTSTNKVARRAGVSIGSLYQYFTNKEALISELMMRHLEANWTLLQKTVVDLAHAPIAEATFELIKGVIATHANRPDLHRVLLTQVPRFGEFDRLFEVERRAIAIIRVYLEARRDEMRPVNLELAAHMVIYIATSIIHITLLERPEYLEGDVLARELTDVIVRYLSCS